MQRPMPRMGNGPVRRPGGASTPMRDRPQPQRMPGRGPAQRPLRRALRPHDGRTAVFVAGSETLHKFVTTRLSTRSDIWIAQALSARNYAPGTAFRMKPDVTIVDVDPIWNPAGLPLARDLAKACPEACPEAHLIMIAPEGYPQGPRIATAAVEPGWSAILRRKGDNGERLLQAIVAGLGGKAGSTRIWAGLSAQRKTGMKHRVQAAVANGPKVWKAMGWKSASRMPPQRPVRRPMKRSKSSRGAPAAAWGNSGSQVVSRNKSTQPPPASHLKLRRSRLQSAPSWTAVVHKAVSSIRHNIPYEAASDRRSDSRQRGERGVFPFARRCSTA